MIELFLQIDGVWFPAKGLEASFDGAVARYRNTSGKAVRFGGFRFENFELPAIPADRLRLFREGWTMASPAGSCGAEGGDFKMNPDYLPFVVPNPREYDKAGKGCYVSSYYTLLGDVKTGETFLAGFVTSADQMTRFEVELGKNGVRRFAAYSDCDGIVVDDGEEIRSEELVIAKGPDAEKLLADYADLWGRRMKAVTWSHTPKGWCSWYYYFSKVTENDIYENLDYVATHRDEYPLEYFQIDDGYQPALGDWLKPSTQFPSGIEAVCRRIASKGIKPGLWFAPFMIESTSDVYREHPEWLVKNAAGEILHPIKWRGVPSAILDCTVPAALDWLRNLFRQVRAAGCVYIKLDFMMYECCVLDGVYADPKATRAQALRRGLLAIREGIGADAFILAATTVLGMGIGILNGERISTDITPYWSKEGELFDEAPTVPNVCRNVINRQFMHKRLWLNDPDVLIVRRDNNKLTEEEIRLWVSALWLHGGLLLLTDRFTTLDPERAKLAKMLLEETDAFTEVRPLDRLEREIPALWAARRRSDGAPVLGVFNFEEEAREFQVDAALFTNGAPSEFWTGAAFPQGGKVTLPPHSVQLWVGKR